MFRQPKRVNVQVLAHTQTVGPSEGLRNYSESIDCLSTEAGTRIDTPLRRYERQCFRPSNDAPSQRLGEWGRWNPRRILPGSVYRALRGRARSIGRRILSLIAGAPGSGGRPGLRAAGHLPRASGASAACDLSWRESTALGTLPRWSM